MIFRRLYLPNLDSQFEENKSEYFFPKNYILYLQFAVGLVSKA